MTVRFISPWGYVKPGQEPAEQDAKHTQFIDHARGVMDALAPWFFPLLDAADAVAHVSPSLFKFSVDDLHTWHEVPDLSQALALVPWAESHETVH